MHAYRVEADGGGLLVATHFANTRATDGSRVVRVPRVVRAGERYAQFSTTRPGEPGEPYLPAGTAGGVWFGRLTASPLNVVMSETEFAEVVAEVNRGIEHAHSGWFQTLLVVADCITFGVVDRTMVRRRRLAEVDRWTEAWGQGRAVQIVPPSATGYLSLDFVVSAETTSLTTSG